MDRNKTLLITFSVILMFVSGCATAPRKISNKDIFLSQIIRIEHKDYLPVRVTAEYYRFKWNWDPFARRISLTKDDDEIFLCVGMEYAMVNGRIEKLDSPVLFYEGTVVVPFTFVTCSMAKFSASSVAVKPPSTAAQRYAIRKIVIDPGHGGDDPGAVGKTGLREKDVVLDISCQIGKELNSRGIEAVFTRQNDKFIPLNKRAQMANNSDADFFISIHANANRARVINGFEVYYLSNAVDDNARAAEAAENSFLKIDDASFYLRDADLEATIWDLVYTENRQESIELARYISKSVDDNTSLKNRGVKSARFYVLKGVDVPSVLVEVGYISNISEEKKLKNAAYRQAIASAIVKGILNYKKIYESTDGFTR